MLFWFSWINKIFSIRYHDVTIHHDTHGQHGLCSLCIITSLLNKRKNMGYFTKNFMINFHNLHRPDKPGVVMHDEMPWKSLHWRHNERDGVSNHQRLHCLLNCWSRRGSKKTGKLRVTGLCLGNSPVIREFAAQKASNAENLSIGWRHRDFLHMAFWMESFDLPNPLHWRHMGAMVSQVTGNSTDCSATPSGKQVRRQIVHITVPLWGESTSH